MLLYLSLSGALLSLLLLYFNAREFRSSIYLGIFFLLVSFYSFHHYIFIYARDPFWIAVLYVNTTSVFYLTGAMGYFYVRSILTDNSRLRWRDAWHFLPAILHFAAAMAYVVKPWSYKMEIGETIAGNLGFMAHHKVNYFSQLIGSTRPVYLSRPLLALGYTVACIVMFVRYRKKQRARSGNTSTPQQLIMMRWLKVFFGFQVMLFFSFASLILIRWPVNPVLQFLNFNDMEFIVGTSLVGLLITPFLFPQILYGLPILSNHITLPYRDEDHELTPAHIELEVAVVQTMPAATVLQTMIAPVETMQEEVEEEPEEADSKSSGIQLEEEYLATLGIRIQEHMEQQKPWLTPGFNLLKLAQQISVPAHHLGYYFREVKQQTFNDYRNAWRVQHAVTMIENGMADELTLEAIGIQSGFSSRSAFFKTFRKVTGHTPGNLLEKKSLSPE
ncbi:AraC family transcriptional regulator [Pseudoflavitalea sp. G-6-1-2]|uniref:helix-turn-helix domain-containing protein n=1 Tax=Pseudoflavitalea sp. G-6-1-2 TaxID=2728841 RepID=UPI00146ACF3C|nr:helix-turn-helix domain-containing protein [Pseudoflavitalea sp. G-6-1-2]NML23872.1 AraC family transcriptional regulator [Pseudoflavitalea sp. G-6-1-2]